MSKKMQLYTFYLATAVHISGGFFTIATGSNNGSLVPDAVDTVVCAPDDGWRNHVKDVWQLTDKINHV